MLVRESPSPEPVRYAFRSFDRQWILADSRLGDYLRPDLWSAHGDQQLYLTSLFNHPLGTGPAVTACAIVPDRHHYRGSYGGKDILPLYRDAQAGRPNLHPHLLTTLSGVYRRTVTPSDFVAYSYGILAQPAFTERYSAELESRDIRVPISKDAELFEKVRVLGARLLWMHTYGERFLPKGKQRGRIPHGSARCTKAVPDRPDSYPESFEFVEESSTLRVGEGEFTPVSKHVFDFEVSGLKVVQSWLKYRMKQGAGKKSSPLDAIRPERWTSQFTTELLEMLWVLEATVAGYPEQATMLDLVVESECLVASELVPVPEDLRKPPRTEAKERGLFD